MTFKNLYEVKDKYFPNITLDELEGKKKFVWNSKELREKLKNKPEEEIKNENENEN